MWHEACLATESETLPIKVLLKGPRPRLPVSVSLAPNLPASPTILALGNATLAWGPAIWAPASPIYPQQFLESGVGHLFGGSLQLARQIFS